MDKVKILLVDDEETLLEATKIYLEKVKQNYQIWPVSSAKEALMVFSNESFDVIICDYLMPKMDGLEFLAQIRDSGNDTPFIMFTGKGREEVVIQALNLGADFYLQKGGDPKSQFRELSNLIEKSVEKKRTEEALRESEEKFRNLAEQSLTGIYIFKDGKVVFANEATVMICGYSHEELLGWGPGEFSRIIHPEDLSIVLEQIEKKLAGDKDVIPSYDIRIISKSGEIKWVSLHSKAFLYEGGLALGVVIVESTERKRIEEERTKHIHDLIFLSETAMSFVELSPDQDIYQYIGEQVKELAGDPIVVISSYDEPSDSFISRSVLGLGEKMKLVMKLLGRDPIGYTMRTPEEMNRLISTWGLKLIPVDMTELSLGQIPKKINDALMKMLQIGEIYSMGFIRKGQPFGAVVIFLRRGNELKNKELIEVFINQAAVALLRKQALDELLEERGMAQKYLDSAPIIIDVIDTDQKVRLINKKGCEVLGYREEEIIGKNWFDNFIPKKRREAVKTIFERFLAGEIEYTTSSENLVLTRSGEERIISWHSTVLRNERGEIESLLSSGEDITVRKRAEEALERHQEQLRRQRDELEAFASSLAHDLRGKLQVIALYNELIESEYSPKIAEQLQEITAFLEELLLLAKKGEILGKLSKINLNRLLGSIARKINSLDPKLQVDIKKLPKIRGDQVKLQQVFENLLINVVQHAEATKVEVFAEEDEKEHRIVIRDNGKGISKEKQEEILDSITKQSYTSIGLMIVTKIVQAHKGSITLESEKGKGTTVIIHLLKKV